MTTTTQLMNINELFTQFLNEHGSADMVQAWQQDEYQKKLAMLLSPEPANAEEPANVAEPANAEEPANVAEPANDAMVFSTGGAGYRDRFEEPRKIWEGQRKHRRDHIVSDTTRRVHVCRRERHGTPFTYLGTIDNSSFVLEEHGNAAEGIPNTYSFSIIPNAMSGTVLNTPLRYTNGKRDFHETAASALGLMLVGHKAVPEGIYNCVKAD